MATKKSRSSTKSAGSAVALMGEVLGEVVQTDVVVSKEDLLTVALVEAEDHMNEQVLQFTKLRDQRAAEANVLRGEAAKQCQSLAEAALVDGRSELAAGLKAFGIKKVEFRVAVEITTGTVRVAGDEVDEDEGTAAKVDDQGRPIYDKFVATIGCYADGVHILSRKKAFKYPDEAVAKFHAAIEADKAAGEAGREAVEWKQRTLQMPALERRYRARLAEAKVLAAKGGDALLAQIKGSLQTDVLKLTVSR